ncbi:MAG: Rrf2 family transcriptional regulator [Candidatus Edwardsbacteria bacterium]|jgi:Rrf2 family protein|nr:Rrf2 family transcriptional regulator [Candidatus Edwardsbacteria bacterium]
MLLTKRNEYALQAMVLLARRGGEGAASARELAAALRTSPGFMSKIARQLAAAGLVRARSGKGGGLALARPARRIRARDIFRAVDGELRVSQCMAEGRCTHRACPVYGPLRAVQSGLDREINAVRLSQFVHAGKGAR